MALQSSVNVTMAYGVESAFGAAASAGGASQYVRRVGSNLSVQKDTFSSNEIRVDQEVADLRHGSRSVRGTVDAELSDATWDVWLAALMRGAWATDVLVPGVLKPSFTIEQNLGEIDVSERFVGCRIASGAFRLPPNGISTVTWEVMGKDGAVLSGSQAPYFTAPAAQTTSGALTGIDGAVTVEGVTRATVTGLDFTINNNCSMTPVIGSVSSPDIFYGRRTVTGTISLFVEDAATLNLYLAEQEVDIVARLTSLDATPRFLQFAMYRTKMTSLGKTLGADGGVIAQMGFQALYQNATNSGSMVISRGAVA